MRYVNRDWIVPMPNRAGVTAPESTLPMVTGTGASGPERRATNTKTPSKAPVKAMSATVRPFMVPARCRAGRCGRHEELR
jgi:hypothetical protein